MWGDLGTPLVSIPHISGDEPRRGLRSLHTWGWPVLGVCSFLIPHVSGGDPWDITLDFDVVPHISGR
jgi:hypothetical protein